MLRKGREGAPGGENGASWCLWKLKKEREVLHLSPVIRQHVNTCFLSVAACCKGFPGGSAVKNLSAVRGTRVQFLGQEDPLEKETAAHSRILACESRWTEEPGGPQFPGPHGVKHD